MMPRKDRMRRSIEIGPWQLYRWTGQRHWMLSRLIVMTATTRTWRSVRLPYALRHPLSTWAWLHTLEADAP